jgi:light-regulated signal transduction histidine kinase (bacteriophytochrome)
MVFSDRLQSRYAAKFDSTGLDYLNRMQNSTRRMQTLINDLLDFSRVTSKGQPFQTVELDKVAREVLDDLETRIEQLGGRVDLEKLPRIEADPIQMRQLLQNLLSNALKFKRPELAPVVKIWSQSSPSNPLNCELIVKDNGIGFEEKYSERIFGLFQRLHGRLDYEGTGIGLALCRKIAERHGGGILAQSQPDEGATFIVTLPYKRFEPVETAQTSL